MRPALSKGLFRKACRRRYSVLRMPLRWLEHARQTKNLVRLYSTFVKPMDLCFDIGANLGSYTDVFLRLGADVVAVEPQDYCMKILERKYRNNKSVRLVQKAVGEKEGEAEFMIASSHTISSLSKEWIQAVRESGRFSEYDWDKSVTVPMTTLDELITAHGRPAFCKIDVEGAELRVLMGLHAAIRCLSAEYTPEFIQSSIDCIRYLGKLGNYNYNYCVGAPNHLELVEWVTPEEIIRVLQELPRTMVGDYFARLTREQI